MFALNNIGLRVTSILRCRCLISICDNSVQLGGERKNDHNIQIRGENQVSVVSNMQFVIRCVTTHDMVIQIAATNSVQTQGEECLLLIILCMFQPEKEASSGTTYKRSSNAWIARYIDTEVQMPDFDMRQQCPVRRRKSVAHSVQTQGAEYLITSNADISYSSSFNRKMRPSQGQHACRAQLSGLRVTSNTRCVIRSVLDAEIYLLLTASAEEIGQLRDNIQEELKCRVKVSHIIEVNDYDVGDDGDDHIDCGLMRIKIPSS
ncbi:hypothetical protein Tco_0974423 [Tanacetum coccineum]|uniref:Uncharacterized protein n=1 Tax=Tanacetum coccineum TaxID=301880 RepID=A0ABQ5EBP1_9ASTR